MALTAQNDSGQSESTDDDKVMRINGRSKEQIGKVINFAFNCVYVSRTMDDVG